MSFYRHCSGSCVCRSLAKTMVSQMHSASEITLPEGLSRFEQALVYAARLHDGHTRKGTTIPYFSHLASVAALVLEHGGSEDQMIAALLHDAVEDRGGHPTLEDIQRRFGVVVARIVEGCSDDGETDLRDASTWRTRKEHYLAHLADAPEDVRLVSAADKLHNARAILTDYRRIGDLLWVRFNARRDDILWYYESLARTFRRLGPKNLANELESVVRTLLYLIRRHETQYQAAIADLHGTLPVGFELDDQSLEFLARLRAAGTLRDADWQHILGQLPEAVRYLSGLNRTVTRNDQSELVLDLDEDPRNADWIRLAAAARKAQHDIPLWAAMWLWQVGHTRGARFWEGVARIADQMQFPRREADPA